MTPNLYIAVGIAGCGKSTYGKQLLENGTVDLILSSDEYRKNILGSEEDQSNNSLVFNILYHDLSTYLSKNKNIYFDATNLTIKDRKRAIDIAKSLKNDVDIYALVFATDINTIKEQNRNRDRVVPEYVIDKMLRKFQLPLLSEGFTRVEIIGRSDETLNLSDELNKCKGFDQLNPHHSLNLYQHMLKAYSYMSEKTNRILLITAALFHDIGKLYTQEYDNIKNKAHYIGHENYGAYLCLTLPFGENWISHYDLALLVNYHMIPYILEKQDIKENTKEKYKKYLAAYWDDIILLHEADKYAH